MPSRVFPRSSGRPDFHPGEEFTMRRTPLIALLAGMLLLSAAGCPPTGSDLRGRVEHDGDFVTGTGTVYWFSLEGGFYAIRGDDGVTYDPMNLPADFKQDGVPVHFRVKVRNELISIHMVGPVVEVVEITRR
jgi:hypothetical protein